MGDRAGYQLMGNGKKTMIYRKQWMVSIESVTDSIVKNLALSKTLYMLDKDYFEPAGSGSIPLRDDLDFGRLATAFINALYTSNFDSLELDVNCDIEDNGLYVLKLVKWNKWEWWHYDIEGEKRSNKQKIAEVHIFEGEKYPNCYEFVWMDQEEKTKHSRKEW